MTPVSLRVGACPGCFLLRWVGWEAAAPLQPRWQLCGRCCGALQGCCPGAPALESLPRLPHCQLSGDRGAAGGPGDGELARGGMGVGVGRIQGSRD